MARLSPKQQDIRDREQRILQLGRGLVLSGGYLGLNLDTIATELGVSRGTIYNHFACKEDLILALLLETMDIRRALLQRAAAWNAGPRQRMAAVVVGTELFARLFPEHFRVEQIVKADSIWEKTSPQRRSLVQGCQIQCVSMIAGIVRDAISRGQVTLPEDMTPEDLVFGVWSMIEGAAAIVAASDSSAGMGIRQPLASVRTCIQLLLDGLGWTPLSSQQSFDDTAKKILKEVFPDEFRRLKQPW